MNKNKEIDTSESLVTKLEGLTVSKQKSSEAHACPGCHNPRGIKQGCSSAKVVDIEEAHNLVSCLNQFSVYVWSNSGCKLQQKLSGLLGIASLYGVHVGGRARLPKKEAYRKSCPVFLDAKGLGALTLKSGELLICDGNESGKEVLALAVISVLTRATKGSSVVLTSGNFNRVENFKSSIPSACSANVFFHVKGDLTPAVLRAKLIKLDAPMPSYSS